MCFLCPALLSHYFHFSVPFSPELKQHIAFLPGSSVCVDPDDEVWRQCF